MKTLVTHSGPYHADDLFAAAVLELVIEKRGEAYELIRTRDEEIIARGDIVFDVGGEYDPERNRFDHHQIGGAGHRENGVVYAAIGLVWKHYGLELCEGDQRLWQKIDEKLIQAIDDGDVGDPDEEAPKLRPYHFKSALKSYYPGWNEPDNFDETFVRLVEWVKEIITNELRLSRSRFAAEELVERDFQNSPDKRIVELSGSYPWHSVLVAKEEPLFVICQMSNGTWGAFGIPKFVYDKHQRRAYFPEPWAGMRDGDLAKASGVPDATYCHNKRGMALAVSKDGAIALARKALESEL